MGLVSLTLGQASRPPYRGFAALGVCATRNVCRVSEMRQCVQWCAHIPVGVVLTSGQITGIGARANLHVAGKGPQQ